MSSKSKPEYVLIEGQGHWDCYKEVIVAIGNEDELKEKLEKLNLLVNNDKENFEKATKLFKKYDILLEAEIKIKYIENKNEDFNQIRENFTKNFEIPAELKQFFFYDQLTCRYTRVYEDIPGYGIQKIQRSYYEKIGKYNI